MKNDVFQKLIYQLVSKLFVLPIYKFVFRGYLIGRENIPQKNSFIMVSNHGSLLDPPLLGHALGRNISFMAKAELFRVPFLGFIITACGAYPVKRGIADKNTSKLTSFILYTILLSLYTPFWTFHMFGDSKWFFVL